MSQNSSSDKGLRWPALLLGLAWFSIFWLQTGTGTGLDVVYRPPFSSVSAGELNFWLAHTLIVLPSAALIGYATAPVLGPRLAELARYVGDLSGGEKTKLLIAGGVVYAATARVARSVVLLDLPVTDEENSLRFVGRSIAEGSLFVDIDIPPDYLPVLFLLEKDGALTSIDFFGGQLAWAFSELTATGPWMFICCSALAFVAVTWTIHQRLGTTCAMFGAAIFGLSPMAASLSMTTHAHVLSRGFLAAFLGLWLSARAGSRLSVWIASGFVWGLGFLCRPFEMLALSFPLLVWTGYHYGLRRRDFRVLGALALGAAPIVAVFLWHNAAVTGDPFLLPRMAPNEFPVTQVSAPMGALFADPGVLWRRLTTNAAHNAYMLHVWFLGLPGVLLALLGMWRDRFTRLLSAGVALLLVASLLHANVGIHAVGPIHFSEVVVPAVILACYGFDRLVSWLADRSRTTLEHFGAIVAATLVLGFGTFNLWNARNLHRSSLELAEPIFFVEAADLPPDTVVLIPRLAFFRPVDGDYVGSWVFELPGPHPDLSDDPLLLRYPRNSDAEDWAADRFPDRNLYRLVPTPQPPHMQLQPMRRTDSDSEETSDG